MGDCHLIDFFYVYIFFVVLSVFYQTGSWTVIIHAVSNYSDYLVLRNYVVKEIFPAILNIKVISFFSISIVFIGGGGIWLPWVRDEQINSYFPGSNVFTFSMALLGSLICKKLFFSAKVVNELLEMFKSDDPRSNIDNRVRDLKKETIVSAWGMIFGAISLILVIVSYANYYDEDSIYGVLGLFFALIIYIFSETPVIERDSRVPKGSQNSNLDDFIPPVLSDSKEIDSNFFQGKG